MDLMPVRGLDGQHDHVAQEGTTVTWSHVMNVCTPHEGVDAARTMTPAIAAGHRPRWTRHDLLLLQVLLPRHGLHRPPWCVKQGLERDLAGREKHRDND